MEGPHEVILRHFPFFMEQATCALGFPNPPGQVVHNHQLVLKRMGKKILKKKNPNWALYVEDIGSYIWLLNLAPEFEQHMKPLSKKSDANLNKKIILHAWSMRF